MGRAKQKVLCFSRTRDDIEAFYKIGSLPQEREEGEKWICDNFHRTPILPHSWENHRMFCQDSDQTLVELYLNGLCGNMQGNQGPVVESFLYTYIT